MTEIKIYPVLLLILITVCLSQKATPPYDYGLGDNSIVIADYSTPPPVRTGVLLLDTGIDAVYFRKTTGLNLIPYIVGEVPPSGKRKKRGVDLCFTLIFITFCDKKKQEQEKIKKALEGVQKEVQILTTITQANTEKIVVLAEATNKISETMETNFQKITNWGVNVDANIEAIRRSVSTLSDRENGRFFRGIADKISRGIFPGEIVGNLTDVEALKKKLCAIKSQSAICENEQNTIPYGMQTASYGSYGGKLWIVATYNYIPPDYNVFKVNALPMVLRSTCAYLRLPFDRVATDKDISTIHLYMGDRLMGTYDNSVKDPELLCYAYTVVSALINFKHYTGRIKLSYSSEQALDLKGKCMSGNYSILHAMSTSCVITFVAPGLSWDPVTRTLDFVGLVMATLPPIIEIPTPSVLPKLNLTTVGTRIDLTEWKKNIDNSLRELALVKEETDSIIKTINPPSIPNLAFGLGISFTIILAIVIFIVVCYCLNRMPARSAILLVSLFLPLAAGEAVIGETMTLPCKNLTTSGNCPMEGLYNMTNQRKGVISIVAVYYKCECGHIERIFSTTLAIGMWGLVIETTTVMLYIFFKFRKKFKRFRIDYTKNGKTKQDIVKLPVASSGALKIRTDGKILNQKKKTIGKMKELPTTVHNVETDVESDGSDYMRITGNAPNAPPYTPLQAPLNLSAREFVPTSTPLTVYPAINSGTI